jgi:hypothetical protein
MDRSMNSDGALISQKPILLDASSEALLVWERDGLTQTNYGAFSLCGPCDVDALKRAVCEAQAGYPRFRANLVPCRRGPWTVWGWRVRPEPIALEVRDLTSLAEAPADMESWIQAEMAPLVEHVQDLQACCPVRIFLFCFPGERHVMLLLFHHCAADGGAFYSFFADVFRIYHRLVTGREPAWAGVEAMHAQAGAVQPIAPISGGRMLRETLTECLKYPPWRAAHPTSQPAAKPGRKIVRHVIDDCALQQAWRDRARRDGGSLSDLFIAASKCALEEFNAARGGDHEIMVHGLAVNQRLRRTREETAGQGVPLGAISVASNSADRRDPESLLRRVIAERKRKMAGGHDYWLSWFGRQLIGMSRALPLGVRWPALRPFFDIRISFMVTNLGVVWPRMENGRPTGETSIREAGRMQLVDLHNSVGTSQKNGGTLILRTFLDRLYLVFPFDRHKIADADAEEFARLVVHRAQCYL